MSTFHRFKTFSNYPPSRTQQEQPNSSYTQPNPANKLSQPRSSRYTPSFSTNKPLLQTISTMGNCGSRQDYEPGYSGPPPPSGNPQYDQWARDQHHREQYMRDQKRAQKKRSRKNGVIATMAGAG
ncbi:hypothetical protein HBH56_031610 [Parastagonospora nodorum]|uniref:Uncharacterized protein n=1 Tax=Phaeosphaeria nodorum (strain SN15 / ATCC MYA-4574 / FGSC 10173) TaxID=321614 RepID=A0A7U2F9Z2_PHANO|nr:hypothetical protein HBH56_031610 [Parastagonospora nodorum]QRD00399.1 hypothetical protein JI435_072600 [Parastagonospora nodorum SN15]KAH3933462.1 hypothetical protein HBH54_067850 [Parastagonospora nodorum]KAH3952702.1 hypothetical protein HBH53_042210 [Parastagonospora nodorum]KAH3979963.1 hypothetical protein HBH51_053240 [Parastagonospora nodorum]